MNEDDLRTMLIDYMGRGFLDNIAALMKQDPSMVRFLPDLLGDDAIVVRLGTTALVEELVKDHRRILGGAVAGLVALLGHENPTIRGDAANVLGIIRDRSAVGALMKLQNDGHASVREIALEAQREIEAEHDPLLNNSGHGEGARDVT